MAKKKPAANKPKASMSVRKKAIQKTKIAQRPTGAPINELDPKRRLGNFAGAGEHPRQGGRTTGIVGQTKQKNRTDK
jgi:hypothetical protein